MRQAPGQFLPEFQTSALLVGTAQFRLCQIRTHDGALY